MLQIKKLKVHREALLVINEISLEVRRGEIVSLLGPNGAGKTTLLLTLSGILKTTEGRIIFEEEDITNMKTHQIVSRGIGHVPQGRHIFPTLSVMDNLMLGAYRKNKPRHEMKKDMERIFQFLPRLKERTRQRAGTLSGGEQQMLSIGRALMGSPGLLLLDEPSMGLAPRLVEELFKILQEINRSGLTIFLVEQEIALSLEISHRGYLLRNGRIIKEGTARTFMEHPEWQG